MKQHTRSRVGSESAFADREVAWQRLVESRRGVYAIVRNEADARALLAQLRSDVRAVFGGSAR